MRWFNKATVSSECDINVALKFVCACLLVEASYVARAEVIQKLYKITQMIEPALIKYTAKTDN